MTDSDPTVQDTSEDPAEFSSTALSFKDRKTGLLVFGILLLLIALASLGTAALQFSLLFLGGGAQSEVPMQASLVVYAGVFYLLVAAGAAWLGIGSIQCRRWARALLHVLAAIALVTGALSAGYMISAFGGMSEQIRQSAGDEAAAIVPIVMGCMVVLFAMIYLILPGAFFLFYRSPHVRATCEHYDPTPRWTDGYPAPMLAGGLILLFAAITLIAPVLGVPMPFFGSFLFGAARWVYALVTGLIALVLALGFFRFDRRAWVGALAFFAVSGASAFLSFRGDGLLTMYESMGFPADQLEMMEAMGATKGFGTLMLVSVIVLLLFYAWLGRYFGSSAPASGSNVEA